MTTPLVCFVDGMNDNFGNSLLREIMLCGYKLTISPITTEQASQYLANQNYNTFGMPAYANQSLLGHVWAQKWFCSFWPKIQKTCLISCQNNVFFMVEIED